MSMLMKVIKNILLEMMISLEFSPTNAHIPLKNYKTLRESNYIKLYLGWKWQLNLTILSGIG